MKSKKIEYVCRALEPMLQTAVADFPAVVLSGPRQSGKTTLLKEFLGSQFGYVSLELLGTRKIALQDPHSFLNDNPPPVIIDEAHHVPELFSYIKERIDNNRHVKGQYVLASSQDWLLMKSVSQSLVGRAGILRLYSLSKREIDGFPDRAVPWETGLETQRGSKIDDVEMWGQLIRGGFPEIAVNTEINLPLWHAGYIQTYLEREAPLIRNIKALDTFQDFLTELAVQSGQLLNLTDISSNLGISINTVKAWLFVLHATGQIMMIHPYFMNAGRKLVKTPKIYFTDVGTLCHLIGMDEPKNLALSVNKGAVLETAVLSEIIRMLTSRGIYPQVHFWRTSSGKEVDFIVQVQGKLIPIEVKANKTPSESMIKGINTFQQDYKDRAGQGFLVHLGNNRLPIGRNSIAIPFSEF